jgi:hypothetical protein
MADTPDLRLHRIIDVVEEIAIEGAMAVRDSSWMPQEIAAQLAERVACAGIPQAAERSAEWLDGWVAACETCAAEIRAHQTIKPLGEG